MTSCLGTYMTPYFSDFSNHLLKYIPNDLIRNTLNTGLSNSMTGFSIGTALSLGAGDDIDEAVSQGGKSAVGSFVTGTITGFSSEIRYSRSSKLSPWTGEKTNRHHSFPKFLGGDKDQDLTTMSVSRHRRFHREFNDYLYEQRNDEGYHMRPQRGNGTKEIEFNFDYDIRFDRTKQFYDSHPLRYWDARFDFYYNNNIIRQWRPW